MKPILYALAALALIAVYFLGRASAPATVTVDTVANELRNENNRLQAARREALATISALSDSLHSLSLRSSTAAREASTAKSLYRRLLARLETRENYAELPDSTVLARLRAGLGAADVQPAPVCVSLP